MVVPGPRQGRDIARSRDLGLAGPGRRSGGGRGRPPRARGLPLAAAPARVVAHPQLAGQVAVFEFVVPPVEPGSRDLEGMPRRGGPGHGLSYASPLLAAAASGPRARHRARLVHLAGVDPRRVAARRHARRTRAIAGPGQPRPAVRPRTFDSTLGAFGGLAATETGRGFLTQGSPTTTPWSASTTDAQRRPLENARDLADLLTPFWGRQVTLDVVGHSRGGLTARSFVESVLPGVSGAAGWTGPSSSAPPTPGPTSPTRPAGGISPTSTPTSSPPTHARSRRSRRRAHRGGRRRSRARDRCPGALARLLRDRPDSVPGIAAMVPDGPFVADLNADQRGQPRSGTPWFVVSSDFMATVGDHPPEIPVAVVTRLVDGVVDHVFTGPNDLVVDVDSMSAIDLPHGGGTSATSWLSRRTAWSTTRTTSPRRSSARALEAWLLRRVDHLEGQERRRRSRTRGHERGVARSRAGPSTAAAPDIGGAPASAPSTSAEPPPDDSFAEGEDDAQPRRHQRGTPPPPAPNPDEPPPRPRPEIAPGRPRLDPGDVRRGAAPESPGEVPATLRVRVSRTALVAADGTASARTFCRAAGQPGRRPGHPVEKRGARGRGPGPMLLPPGGGWSELQFALHAVAAGTGPDQGSRPSGSRAARQRRPGGRGRRPERRDGRRAGDDPGPGRGRVGDVPGARRRRVAGDRPGGGGRQTRFRYELRLPGRGSPDRITGTRPRSATRTRSSPACSARSTSCGSTTRTSRRSTSPTCRTSARPCSSSCSPRTSSRCCGRTATTSTTCSSSPTSRSSRGSWSTSSRRSARGRRPRFLGQLGLVRWQFTPFPTATAAPGSGRQGLRRMPGVRGPVAGPRRGAGRGGQFLTDDVRGHRGQRHRAEGAASCCAVAAGSTCSTSAVTGWPDNGNIAEAKIVLAGRTVGGALVSDYLTSTTVAENAQLGTVPAQDRSSS